MSQHFFFMIQQFFLSPTLVVARRKNIFPYFFTSLPSSKLTISLISIYKHYAIDIADPSSRQDVCHLKFVIDLAHRGVSLAQWESIGARNPKA